MLTVETYWRAAAQVALDRAAPRCYNRGRVIRRLATYRSAFDDDDPVVFILAPAASRPVPAGDTRRGTAWLFRTRTDAARFGDWIKLRHGLDAVPVAVRLRELAHKLASRDLTFVLDPEPCAGYGNPLSFKAPLEN